MAANELVVIYDGECGLCSRTVNWIAARDREAKFRFVSARSDMARRTLQALRLDLDPLETVVLIDGPEAYGGSTALLRIAARLRPPWSLLRCLLWVPEWLRGPAYRLVARHRGRLFGGLSCPTPDPRFRGRFLG